LTSTQDHETATTSSTTPLIPITTIQPSIEITSTFEPSSTTSKILDATLAEVEDKVVKSILTHTWITHFLSTNEVAPLTLSSIHHKFSACFFSYLPTSISLLHAFYFRSLFYFINSLNWNVQNVDSFPFSIAIQFVTQPEDKTTKQEPTKHEESESNYDDEYDDEDVNEVSGPPVSLNELNNL